MPADRKDLAARVAVATPTDTVRGLVFNAAFEVAQEHGDALAVACDPAGRGRRTDFRTYPVAEFLQVAWAIADAVEGRSGDVDAAFRAMGYRTTVAVLGSMLGSTLLSFGSSPRTLVEQVPAAYKAVVTYGERLLTWEGPTRGRLELVRDFLPLPFHEGVLRGAVDGTSARDPRIAGRALGFMHHAVEVGWTP